MSQWIQLERGNDWGVEYFSLPGQSRSAAGTCSRSRGLSFAEGLRIAVRWPDGTITYETVSNKHFRASVSDMGHAYDVSYDLAGFKSNVRGIETWIALDQVEVPSDLGGQPK